MACRQLGFNGTVANRRGVSAEGLTSPVPDLKFYWNVSCTGNETDLAACQFEEMQTDSPSGEAYLLCTPPGGELKEGACDGRQGASWCAHGEGLPS